MIESLSYRLPSDNYSIGVTFKNSDHYFIVEYPGVNNIGSMEWTVNGNNRPIFTTINNYNEVNILFEKKNKDSLWLNEDSYNVNIY